MDRIRIRGGRSLSGTIPISGAKNAALTLMPAAILTEELDLNGFGCVVGIQPVTPGVQPK